LEEHRKEYNELIESWQLGELPTDELEERLKEINKKYNTNYKITGRRINYGNNYD